MTQNTVQAWVLRSRTNLSSFNQVRPYLKTEDQLTFIRGQYAVLNTVIKVAQGKARFQGYSRP